MQGMCYGHRQNQLQLFGFVIPLGAQLPRGMPSAKTLFALFKVGQG